MYLFMYNEKISCKLLIYKRYYNVNAERGSLSVGIMFPAVTFFKFSLKVG